VASVSHALVECPTSSFTFCQQLAHGCYVVALQQELNCHPFDRELAVISHRCPRLDLITAAKLIHMRSNLIVSSPPLFHAHRTCSNVALTLLFIGSENYRTVLRFSAAGKSNQFAAA